MRTWTTPSRPRAERDLADRVAAGLPPATRMAALLGAPADIVEVALGEPGRVPSQQRLHGAQGVLGGDEDASARCGETSGREPSAHRVLGGVEERALQEHARVEDEDGAVARIALRLGARRRDDDRGLGPDPLHHPAGMAGLHGDARERAADLLGGALGAHRDGSEPAAAA